jgi:hypothetical protein
VVHVPDVVVSEGSMRGIIGSAVSHWHQAIVAG